MAGRKRKLNPRLAERILELIADGLTIRQVFEKEEIDYTVKQLKNVDEDLREIEDKKNSY